MNPNKIWKTSKSDQLFIYSIFATLVTTFYTLNWLLFSESLLNFSLTIVLTLTLISYFIIRLFLRHDEVEKIVNKSLSLLDPSVVDNPPKTIVVFLTTDKNKVSCVQYGESLFFSDSPVFGGYKVGQQFIEPDFFWFAVRFEDETKPTLIFVIERVSTKKDPIVSTFSFVEDRTHLTHTSN